MSPNPKRLDHRVNIATVDQIKRPDCAFYNDCLDQAINGKWKAFSCEDCTAYSEPDSNQRESDVVSLKALHASAKIVEKHGRLDRKRGVKEGASR